MNEQEWPYGYWCGGCAGVDRRGEPPPFIAFSTLFHCVDSDHSYRIMTEQQWPYGHCCGEQECHEALLRGFTRDTAP